VPSHPKEIRLLASIKNSGEVVTKDEFRKLAVKAGYDPRGTAALFAYPPNNTVAWVGGNKVGITPRGLERVAKYPDWLATQ
jgi:hypothetical protein